MMWPLDRVDAIQRLLKRISTLDRIRFRFVPSDETRPLGYFAQGMSVDLESLAESGFDLIPSSDTESSADIFVGTAHGCSDQALNLHKFRQRFPDTHVVLWFWDNHFASQTNLRTALLADIVFPSHLYAARTIANPCSILAGHVPSCSAQWTTDVAARLFAASATTKRSDRLLVNYVDYPTSWRSAVLRQLATDAPEADVKLMTPGDRSRYFSLDPLDRLNEWLAYKASLLLPLEYDLSTRAFDALLAGHVLVVPDRIADLASVIPPEDQDRLGVVKLPDTSVAAVRWAAGEAVRRFDAGGPAGIAARHAFALNAHMLKHRVAQMLQAIRDMSVGRIGVKVGGNAEWPFGLYAIR